MSAWDDPITHIRELEAEVERLRKVDTSAALEGVVVDDEAGVERFCEAIVETLTEFDWRPDMKHSLPGHLRDGLRRWARDFRAWDRSQEWPR